MIRLKKIVANDRGFTIMEVIVAIVLTGILANLFGQVMATTAEMYAAFTLRKTAHVDARRALEMMSHDLREWTSWGTASANALIFNQVELYQRTFLFWTYTYYDVNQTGYNFGSNKLIYKRADEGAFTNEMSLIERNVVMSESAFSTATLGGKQRIKVEIRILANGQYFKVRTAVFPRFSGG